MWPCHRDALCEQHSDLSMDLRQTTNGNTSLASDHLQSRFSLHLEFVILEECERSILFTLTASSCIVTNEQR